MGDGRKPVEEKTRAGRVEFTVSAANKLLIRRAAALGAEDFSVYARRVVLEHARQTLRAAGQPETAIELPPEKAKKRKGARKNKTIKTGSEPVVPSSETNAASARKGRKNKTSSGGV